MTMGVLSFPTPEFLISNLKSVRPSVQRFCQSLCLGPCHCCVFQSFHESEASTLCFQGIVLSRVTRVRLGFGPPNERWIFSCTSLRSQKPDTHRNFIFSFSLPCVLTSSFLQSWHCSHISDNKSSQRMLLLKLILILVPFASW